MISDDKIIEIFCKIDDHTKIYERVWKKSTLTGGKRKRNRKFKLSMSEVITISVLFHYSGYRNFKTYYNSYVKKHMRSYFPDLVSYNRMVELMSATAMPMFAMLQYGLLGESTGISFIDSTPLKVSHNKRIHSHKTFQGLAARGKSSTGWFYGFKFHFIVNDEGTIIAFTLTPGNTDDRKPLENEAFTKKLWGKLYGDKGYISKKLFENLVYKGVHLYTKLKKNMKTGWLMEVSDAIMLRKRAIIETIVDQLKNIYQIEHSRHRSINNFLTNLMSAIMAYNFSFKKPSIKQDFVQSKQLRLFT